MKTFSVIAGLALFLNGISSPWVSAQSKSATQLVRMEVRPVTRLVVSDDPQPLIITRQAGKSTHSVSDEHTRYSLMTNLENMKISASIDRHMPQGTSLKIRLKSSRGISRGEVDLSNALAPREVVSGIGRGMDRDQSITYIFSADPGLRELSSDARMITLTLTD